MDEHATSSGPLEIPTPLGGTPSQRYFVYGAVAMYESVVPGMPAYRTLVGQLTDLPAMPETLPGYAYYWPACVNATMAAMTRNFFTAATAASKASVDSLELALNDGICSIDRCGRIAAVD